MRTFIGISRFSMPCLLVVACGGLDGGETSDASHVEAVVAACPTSSAAEKAGQISTSSLAEASGLVASVRNPGLFYSHNDSGGSARIYALREDGALVADLSVSGARAQDWEDIAVGPGPDAGVSYIYVGDIGDNAQSRSDIRVYRSAEPNLDAAQTNQRLSVAAETIRLRYPDGAHNAETLMVDPITADLYVLTKLDSGNSALYVAHAPLSSSAAMTLQSVASLKFGTGNLSGSPLATGGDIARNGSAALVRTYSGVFLWRRAETATLAEAFAEPPCALTAPREKQGEALAFSVDGSAYYSVSEGSRPPLYRMRLSW
jgi:hypothetical protein